MPSLLFHATGLAFALSIFAMTIRKVAPQSATNHRLIWIATSWLALIFAAVLSFSLVFFYHQPLFMSPSGRVILEHISTDLCPQADPISPTFHFEILQNLDEYLSANAGKQWAVDSLSGAVQVPTQTFENISDPGNDTRWDVFHEIYSYLERRFPRIHSELEITQINRYARIFQWKGSDSSLKPLVLTGHVDVIPVNPETEDEWIHPPFSGFFDGTWIWGRGSADDKSMVIATLSAVEALLEQGFQPMRTVVLAYGFDEERGGRYGARQISLHLQEVYGRGGAAMLVDEGGQYRLHDGVVIAAPNIAEKGSLNVKIEVTTPGGHSSMPPARTGIGFLSSLITTLEMNPFPAKLWRNSTFYHMLQCSSAHDTSLPAARRALIALSSTDDGALRQLEADLIAEDEPYFRAFSGTTQAIDIVAGGLKVNALPENAYAVANHRIAEHSSTDDVRARYIDLLAPAAKALNLTFDGFGKAAFEEGQPSKGHVTLSTTSRGLRPAPVTPTEGSGAWDLLSGTILSSLQTTTRTDIDVKSVVVTPGIMIANSDTKWYWNLTSNIFRYSHFGTTDRQGMHTTNEAAKAEAYVESIRFWVRLILNADESRSLDS